MMRAAPREPGVARQVLLYLAPAGSWQLAFYGVPIALLLLLTFQASENFRVSWVWSLDTWINVFTAVHVWFALMRTLVMSVFAVVCCFALAFPVAYVMVTRLRAYDAHIKLAILFAFLSDMVLKTYGWVPFLDQEGILSWILRAVGGVVPADFDTGLVFTPVATLLGIVANLLPFMIFTIYLSLSALDRDLLLAAYDSGASRLRAFRDITLPLCLPGVLAGGAFVFILSMGSLVEERVLGGGKSPMMGTLIRQTFETRVNWPLGAALTVVLFAVTIAVLAIAGWQIRRMRGKR
jgi:spermidine/putrescine transport system permease protein